MAFFDKVTDKAKELADSAKINVRIIEEKRRIAELKDKAGMLVWDKYCEGAKFDAELLALCGKIKAAYDNIDSLNDQLNSIRSRTSDTVSDNAAESTNAERKCISCGALVAEGQHYCGNCGTKIPEPYDGAAKEAFKHAEELDSEDSGRSSDTKQNVYGAEQNYGIEHNGTVAEQEHNAERNGKAYEQNETAKTHACPDCGAKLSNEQASCTDCGLKC